MRQSLKLLQYVPSIKFVGGPHPIVHTPVSAHPCAPSGLMPSAAKASAPLSGHALSFQSRNNLSKRFRYSPIDDLEIDDVLTGGADYLIK